MPDFLLALASAAWLFAPLLCAALLAAVVQRGDHLRPLRRPLDFGATLGGKRLFGDSKTWRGVVVAVLGCAAGATAQHLLPGNAMADLAVVDFERVPAPWFGAAMGLGAMLGELPNSFVKRRLGIAPGTTTRGPLALLFYVWDQIDLVLGAWPLIACWIGFDPVLFAASLLVALCAHPTVSLLGWLIGARRTAR